MRFVLHVRLRVRLRALAGRGDKVTPTLEPLLPRSMRYVVTAFMSFTAALVAAATPPATPAPAVFAVAVGLQVTAFGMAFTEVCRDALRHRLVALRRGKT